jgi:hypothetical protein
MAVMNLLFAILLSLSLCLIISQEAYSCSEAVEPSHYVPPEDAVLPKVCYRPANMNFKLYSEDKSHYELQVSNVVDPGLFWVQRRTTHLDELMDRLE